MTLQENAVEAESTVKDWNKIVSRIVAGKHGLGARTNKSLIEAVARLCQSCYEEGRDSQDESIRALGRSLDSVRLELSEAKGAMNRALDLLSVGADEEDNEACKVLKAATEPKP